MMYFALDEDVVRVHEDLGEKFIGKSIDRGRCARGVRDGKRLGHVNEPDYYEGSVSRAPF